MSMELSDVSGNVTYGVSKVGSIGTTYKLTADYTNSDTVNMAVRIRKTMMVTSTLRSKKEYEEGTERRPVPLRGGDLYASSMDDDGKEVHQAIAGTEQFEVKSAAQRVFSEGPRLIEEGMFEEFNVPIYVGIGLRIVAEGRSLSADANISGIGVVGAEAEAKKLSGSLTVQTLGVNSQAVASALPVQSELSRTTAENAFVAIGAIKAMLHQPETVTFPRVVGLYLPFPGGKPLVNALISELSRDPVRWCPAGYEKTEDDDRKAESGSDR
jgi:hypothetical protein